jgi:hypothetical protein
MTLPVPAEVLRHRPPALLVEAIETFDGQGLTCRAVARDGWRWPEMLEGGAQTAGLLAGLQKDGLSNRAVIAEYAGVVVHVAEHQGPLRFRAHLERRILRCWRCRIEVRDASDALLLAGSVTLAPGEA